MHRIHIVTAPPTPYALSERQEAMQIELCSSNSFLRFAYLIQVQVWKHHMRVIHIVLMLFKAFPWALGY